MLKGAATFARRNTALPAARPLALTKEFAADAAKQRQWKAFLSKNRIAAGTLEEVVALLDLMLWPASQVALARSDASAFWQPAAGAWE